DCRPRARGRHLSMRSALARVPGRSWRTRRKEKTPMAVNVCLPLFGNPGRELEEETAVKGQQLRDLGDSLRERLHKAATTLDKLAAAGWTTSLAMYEVFLLHDDVQTREDATRRLRELELDPDEFMIIEEVEEDDAS